MLFSGDKLISKVLKRTYVLSEIFGYYQKHFIVTDVERGTTLRMKYSDLKEHFIKKT